MQGVDITINMILDTWCKANMQFRMLAGSELSGIEKSQATHKASAVKLDYFRWKMKVGWDKVEKGKDAKCVMTVNRSVLASKSRRT